jgi:4-alpha-glucanotransferase
VGDPDEVASSASGVAPLFVRRGATSSVPAGTVVLEDGGAITVGPSGTLPADVPIGYHELTPRDGDGGAVPLIVSPRRCHLPDRWRAWGWAAQVYASRSRASWGMGDLRDLATLAEWSATQHGAKFLMVNPLHAASPGVPQEASPYSPTSRRFRNPLYIHVEDVPGSDVLGGRLDELARQGRALNDSRSIDRDAVLDLKLGVLELIWEQVRSEPAFERWLGEQDIALQEYATWVVLAETFGPSWREWPEQFRRPGTSAVRSFADEHAPRVRFHCWLQWLTQLQLDRAGEHLAVIQDLPIGFDRNGADSWSWQHLVAAEASVGAPPDEFNPAGQDWGLPPFVPWRLQRAGYRPFIETVRATMPRNGGLRIDHIMGLFRLWWVPQGESPDNGGYVRYPTSDLLDIIAIESERAGALVVGEDLGTVEEGVREEMADRRILSYRLLWFEDDDPAEWPPLSMAAVTTHDLPTVAGVWDGSDVIAQKEFGVDPNEEGWEEIRTRVATATSIAEDASPVEAVEAAYTLLARAPSVLLSATLDDAAAEPERPNMPGVTDRPNWCIALANPIEDLIAAPLPAAIATTLRAAADTTPPARPVARKTGVKKAAPKKAAPKKAAPKKAAPKKAAPKKAAPKKAAPKKAAAKKAPKTA